MDDESAEIELLEQNLNKTRLISQRMSTILTEFDTRLVKLEKSILPLYNSTQVLNRRAHNIDQTLLKIDEMTSNQEGIAAEEALILRGPQPGQLDVYKDTLERLNASIAFKSTERDVIDTARLVETGAKKIVQQYTKLVAEASSGTLPPPLTSSSTPLTLPEFPSPLVDTLTNLVAFLRSLPVPTTHPSHPAASSILATLKDAQRGYADMRGAWAKKWLESQAKRVVDRADTIDALQAGQEIGLWTRSLLLISEDEYERLKHFVPLLDSTTVASSYKSLLSPLLGLFESTISSLIALIKRSLYKYSFLALSTYQALSALAPRWERIFSRVTSESRIGGGGKNELKEGLNALRSVCLRSFPEFLADVKMASMGKAGAGELGTGLADMTISTIEYLNKLPSVQEAAGSALLSLGDGNWKMGEGLQVGKTPKNEDAEDQNEKTILEHFVHDLVTTTISSLTALSHALKRPSTGSVFLLNNVTHLSSLLLECDPPNPLLSPSTCSALQSACRTAKAGYFDANFTPLMQALGDSDPHSNSKSSGGSGGKSNPKEKMIRFFDLLDEVVERHKLAGLIGEGEDGREMKEVIGVEMSKMVGSAMRGFVQKHRDKEFSKNPQKYIKMTPEAVEQQIRNIYR